MLQVDPIKRSLRLSGRPETRNPVNTLSESLKQPLDDAAHSEASVAQGASGTTGSHNLSKSDCNAATKAWLNDRRSIFSVDTTVEASGVH